jgi:FkbM family methyltransferase
MQKSVKIFGRELTLNMRNDGDYAIASELFLDHQYKQCDKVIREAQNSIIDIGGHLGFFSVYAAILNPKVPIYTFEPHTGNYELLKQNLKDNRIKNVFPKNLAVSDAVGQEQLQISKEDLNHSTTKALEPTGESQSVQTISLQRILEKNHLMKVDLLKIDCEGAEFKIIRSTPKAIFDTVSTIFLEYHDWIDGESHQSLKKRLEQMGYRVERYPNSKIKELGYLWCS